MSQILKEDMPPMQSKKIAIFIGRYQPPTIGHYKVINEMVDMIRKHNHKRPKDKLETTPFVAIITGKKTSKDGSRNPLDPDTVEKIMKASGQIDSKTMFIHGSNLFDALANVRKKGYEPVMVFGGDDRGTKGDAPYKDILDKYFKTPDGKDIEHTYVSFKRNNVADLGEKSVDDMLDLIKKDDEVDASVVSGTLARRAVEKNMPDVFAKIVGLSKKPEISDIAFRKVQTGLKKKDESK